MNSECLNFYMVSFDQLFEIMIIYIYSESIDKHFRWNMSILFRLDSFVVSKWAILFTHSPPHCMGLLNKEKKGILLKWQQKYDNIDGWLQPYEGIGQRDYNH